MASLDFRWGRPQNYEEGWVYRLYETYNGEQTLVADDIVGESFSLIMEGKPEGTYGYSATTYAPKTKLESDFSNVVLVNFIKPLPPADFAVSWAG